MCISTESSDEDGVDATGNMTTYMFVRSISPRVHQDCDRREARSPRTKLIDFRGPL